jgi:putative SOS response-associated peptidase YedK
VRSLHIQSAAGGHRGTFEVAVPETYQHRVNLAPQQRALIVRERDDVREAVMAKWGLLPHWATTSRWRRSTASGRSSTHTG